MPRKYLYSCFVDFKSAFDTVWRDGMFYKLMKMGVGGNFLKVLQSMYSNVNYSIKINNQVSQEFTSSVGVKQGCCLSPLLFNMYIADLPDIFDANCHPVYIGTNGTVPLSCLLFADDLVLLSETSVGLQTALNRLEAYCRKWGLTINNSKTKIVIFNKGGLKISKNKFFINGNELEIVQSYCYLGIILSSCGSFTRAIAALYDKARKALFALQKLDTQEDALLTIKLFDTLVLPVLTYGIEVWGPYHINSKNLEKEYTLKTMFEPYHIEKLNVHLCKFILGVSRKSTNDAVRGELGRLPILLLTMKRYLNYAQRCYNLPDTTLVKLTLPSTISNNYEWISKIAGLLHKSTPDMQILNISQLLNSFSSQSIQEHFISSYETGWLQHINKEYDTRNKNKLRSYATYKLTFDIENYVKSLNRYQRRNFTKLRISAHHLAIETGRYTKPPTPRDERICKFCTLNAIGDEKHFLLSCPKFENERINMFNELSKFMDINNKEDFHTFFILMNYYSGDIEVAKIVSTFVDVCFKNIT